LNIAKIFIDLKILNKLYLYIIDSSNNFLKREEKIKIKVYFAVKLINKKINAYESMKK
jgi:hypothetical protein